MDGQTHDTTVIKVDASSSSRGPDGLRHLASGRALAMRLWEDEEPGDMEPMHAHDYETVGYAIRGLAELHVEGQVAVLRPGDSWVVPPAARHAYRIRERFTALEATHPPYPVQGRDAV